MRDLKILHTMSRRSAHAGTWYHNDSKSLQTHLNSLLSDATRHQSVTRAIIVPHAGYRFAGKTAAHAYKSVNTEGFRRVFLIAPCHFQFFDGCALPDPSLTQYETPLGPLALDLPTINQLRSQSEAPFRCLRIFEDEEEHSIEMQLPFLKLLTKERSDVTIVPIYVGSIVQNDERMYARILAKYFDEPSSLFIISSDFCHWGNRFRYTPRDFPSTASRWFPDGSMNANIEALDNQAFNLIRAQDSEGFSKYLQSTGNTICGRNCLLIFLQILRQAQTKAKIDFVHYSQSATLPALVSREDFCVSYAAGVVTV
jgi:hypothetical protein